MSRHRHGLWSKGRPRNMVPAIALLVGIGYQPITREIITAFGAIVPGAMDIGHNEFD